MRRYLLFCALSIMCAGVTAGAQQRPVRSDQDLLIQIEKDWDAAFLKKDVAFIETVLAEEFAANYADGTTGTRATELTGVAEFNQQVDSSTVDDFTVKVYGDTAIVRFMRHLIGPIKGQPHQLNYRFLDVFVWRDGRWQCVASSAIKLPM